MARLTQYTAATRFDADDILIKDGTNGTKKITVEDAAAEFAGLIDPMNHRCTYRGKSLGDSVTDAQKTAISNGTFDDLFIGDYWTINNINYRIADMDYWYNCGDTAFTKHHLVVVPESPMYTAQMNSENVTDGGYVGSEMYTTNLESARTTISTAFGGLLLTHREYLVNAVASGRPSAGAWYDSQVELMNEIMVYGAHIYAPMSNGVTVPNRYTIDKQQLALFALNPKMVNRRYSYWLRDVVSSAFFANVANYGHADCRGASDSLGVRPVFAVGA